MNFDDTLYNEYLIELESLPRHDKDLVAVVEELGDKANGYCAKLEVVEINSNLYRTTEYDGAERFGTFETNSSSCHSLTVMRKQDWEDFKNYKKFINSSIDKTDSDDGYYGLEAQFLNPDVFIDLDELKKKLSEIDPEGSKFMENMTSEDIRMEMNKRDSKLRDYIYDLHENDLEVYDDDDECGWGMTKVTGSNFGGDTEVVAVSREICC